MELVSSRWHMAKLALGAGFLVGPMAGSLLGGLGASQFGPISLAVFLALPVLAYCVVPTRVLARVDGSMLHINGKAARVGDLIGIKTQTMRVNLIPVHRNMIFSFRARDTDGMIARALGSRKLMLSVSGVAGGRKAAEAFAADVLAMAGVGSREGAATPPQPARPQPVRTPEVATAEAQAGFDPDAIIARYLAQRTEAEVELPAPMPPPARIPPVRGFGRKGL